MEITSAGSLFLSHFAVSSRQVFSIGTVAAYSAKYSALVACIQNTGTVPILKSSRAVSLSED